MNNVDKNIQENAKVDWMKLVNKHRKRQKGLPALSKLNTNAGNVEHNINMFNMMQPDGSATVDASNGNVSSGESACCEAVESKDEMITLHYDNIPVEVVVRRGRPRGYYDTGMRQWYPDEDKTRLIHVSWTYDADKQDVIEFLQDISEVQEKLGLDSIDDADYDKKLNDTFDKLVAEYLDDIKDYFYDDAIQDAQENYKYNSYYESLRQKTCYDKTILDDNFDMSMRSLL